MASKNSKDTIESVTHADADHCFNLGVDAAADHILQIAVDMFTENYRLDAEDLRNTADDLRGLKQ